MHVFEVDFQLDQFRHIYRGVGKSKIQYVLFNVPYRTTSEIGAMDGVFGPEMSDSGGKVSPWEVKNDDF